jgi:hypothetical protein
MPTEAGIQVAVTLDSFKTQDSSPFRRLHLKLMLFWHQIFIAAAKSLCQQGFPSYLENVNFLVLAMPG